MPQGDNLRLALLRKFLRARRRRSIRWPHCAKTDTPGLPPWYITNGRGNSGDPPPLVPARTRPSMVMLHRICSSAMSAPNSTAPLMGLAREISDKCSSSSRTESSRQLCLFPRHMVAKRGSRRPDREQNHQFITVPERDFRTAWPTVGSPSWP